MSDESKGVDVQAFRDVANAFEQVEVENDSEGIEVTVKYARAFCPETVLQMLDEIEEMRREVDQLRDDDVKWTYWNDLYVKGRLEIESLHCENERLKQANRGVAIMLRAALDKHPKETISDVKSLLRFLERDEETLADAYLDREEVHDR